MAIDTENKRRSVQSYSTGLMPVPDGTIGAADRATVGWRYAGITYSALVAVTFLAAQFHKLFGLHHNISRFN